jgi:hypothetical protein
MVAQLFKHHKWPLLVAFFFVVSSCTSIRLISDYDEITDKAMNALQEKVTKTLVKLDANIGTNETAYEKYKGFYEEVKVDLNTLQIRTNAIDKNEIEQRQVQELSTMIDNLEKLHKLGFNSLDQIKLLKQPFNAAFTALTKLQIAKKSRKKY